MAKLLAAVTWLAVALAGQGEVFAAEPKSEPPRPSTAPQPLVLDTMHIGRIAQIRATADESRLVTIGSDKTLRTWRMADLAPLRTVHLPAEPGLEGEPRSLAVHPDGRRAFVAGWTGITWAQRTQVYVVDMDTGRIVSAFDGGPGTLKSMAVSPDGQWLALGLSWQTPEKRIEGVLRIVRTSDGSLVNEDPQYWGELRFMDFSVDGVLGVSSADGCVRLYEPGVVSGQDAASTRWRARFPARPGSGCDGAELGGVRFSPDGRQVVFGVQDRPEILILQARAPHGVVGLIRSSDERQLGWCCAHWTRDGQQLLVWGEHRDARHTVVTRLSGEGFLTPEVLPLGEYAITNVLPTRDGGMVISTEAPLLVRADARAQVLAVRRGGQPVFHDLEDGFRVSADGHTVDFQPRPGRPPMRFSVTSRVDRMLTSAGDSADTLPPVRQQAALAVQATLGRFSFREPLRIGGHDIRLDPAESLWAWAGHRERREVVLGTQWAVRYFNEQGRALWSVMMHAPVHAVQISGDGRWVLAAVSDGTIRWLAREDGSEALALYVDAQDYEWAAWRPDGRFVSSPRGDRRFGWLINRGAHQNPAVVRAVQVERAFYDAAAAAEALGLGRGHRPGAGPAAHATSGPSAGQASNTAPRKPDLTTGAVPTVTILSLTRSSASTLDVEFEVAAGVRPVREMGAFVNGIPVLDGTERRFDVAAGAVRRHRLELPSLGSDTAVLIEAETGDAFGQDETRTLSVPGRQVPSVGNLHVLSIGIGTFPAIAASGKLNNLLAPEPDVRVVSSLLEQAGRSVFRDVRVRQLTDKSRVGELPTRQAIVSAFDDLARQVKPQDTVVVHLATHGATDGHEFYLVPRDASPIDFQKIEDSRSLTGRRLQPREVASMITGTQMTELLRRIPGRRIVILDACHSGANEAANDPSSLIKRGAAAQVALMSSASSDELAKEDSALGHSWFAFGLINGLTAAQVPGSVGGRQLNVSDLFKVAANHVRERSKQATALEPGRARFYRQTPTYSAPPELDRSVLAQF